MKKIISSILNFFDKILVVPMTKLVYRLRNLFSSSNWRFEAWLSKSNTLLYISLVVAIILSVAVNQKLLVYSENNAIVCAYPEEWMKRRIGINYFIREQRDSMINAITEEDIEETGVVVENPVIGHIPSRQEIVNELEELLMTM